MKNKSRLCLGTVMGFEIDPIDQMKVIKDCGFDAVFTDMKKHGKSEETEMIANKAAQVGLYYHSLHAPFYGMDDMWHDESGELWSIIKTDLINAVDDCSRFDIPLVIMHSIIGMDNHTPTQLGVDRVGEIIDYAVKRGINIGFENTEGEEYLKALFDNYGEIENVGFTFDSGHEMCYNKSTDMLGKFGKYLVSTHLNDNKGMTDVNNPTFLDDLHLLPFDGIGNWTSISDRLKKCGFSDYLTFELNSKPKTDSDLYEKYRLMSFEEFVSEAYNRADIFRRIFDT